MRYKDLGKKIGILTAIWLSGCLGSPSSSVSENSSVQAVSMADYPERCTIRPTTTPTRPDRLCGVPGYTYLLQYYLRPQCGGCHDKDNIVHWNGFADSDVPTAMRYARYYLGEQQLFLLRVRDNPFISQGCTISTSDPVYKDLQEWLSHPDC